MIGEAAMRFTEEQRAAIDSRGENLLIAAAAGSGKTTVLVERVMQLVAEGANIDDMLIVTFTRASAADLRAKLSQRLMDAENVGPEQSVRLERATIGTIHGFCAELLRSHFEAADISPGFRVLDDANARRMEDEAMDEAMEEAYEAGGADLDALDYGRGPKKVRALALELHRALESRCDPEEWLKISANPDCGEMLEILRQAALIYVEEAAALCETAAKLAALPDVLPGYVDALLADAGSLNACRDMTYSDLRTALSDFQQAKVKASRGEGDEQLRERVKAMRKSAKETAASAAGYLRLSEEDALEDMARVAPAMRALAQIVLSAEEKLSAMKAEEGVLSYGDLEKMALKALNVPECAEAVRERYKWVFVDEYQDTSEIQEAIIGKLLAEGNAFFVGDVKQSIYRFRMAEPGLFLSRQQKYAEGTDGRLIALTANFRSSDSVVSFVNAVFERAMRGGADEIVYSDVERLRAGRGVAGPEIEVHLMGAEMAEEDDESEDDSLVLTGAKAEAYCIAQRIHELMDEDANLNFRDIAVITRVKQNVLAPMAEVLANEGIPVYADEAGGYTDAFEVRLALALLKLIDNHLNDIALLAVLRSPIVGLSSAELAHLRLAAGEGPLYRAVKESESGVLTEFARKMEDWRDRARRLPLGRFIDTLLLETGLVHYVSAMPAGKARRANLQLLCSRADAYEKNGDGGLSGFLQHTEDVARRGGEDSAHVLTENDNVVRLLSAHKSKGLEYPVVFAAQLGREFRRPKADDSLSWHAGMGYAISHTDSRLSTRRETLARRAIACKKAAEDLAEEKRILYVLLTRARDRLILVGTPRNRATSELRWEMSLSRPLRAKSALDVVMPAVLSMGIECEWHAPAAQMTAEKQEESATPIRLRDAILESASHEPDEKLLEAMLWKYPYEDSAGAPLKLTVTGLVREVEGPTTKIELTEKPKFLSDKENPDAHLTAAQFGTDIHRILAQADLDKIRGGGKISERRVQAFFESNIGRRLLASPRVEREWAFNLRLSPEKARSLGELDTHERVMVQGIIDACFMENDEWILVDYKSGRDDPAYHKQIQLYAYALRAITGKRVAEAYVYLLGRGEARRVNLENGID